MKNSYSIETMARCCSLYRDGKSVNCIMEECQIPRSTVYNWIHKNRSIRDLTTLTPTQELLTMEKKYQKAQHISEILKLVNCTCQSPLAIKMYELEKLTDQYSIRTLCDALDVDRGTFYNYLYRNKRTENSYTKRRAELSIVIRNIYEENRGLFGSDKILAVMQRQGYHTSKKMVRELMREMGIASFRSHSKKDAAILEKMKSPKNIVQRDFTAEAPNLVWLSDCTQFTLLGKKYYLCAILDVFSRKIIAYKISARASTQLVTATFKEAYEIRHPDNKLIFHSDRGCQYTSYAFRKLLISMNVTQSFSQPGTPYDNGAMESFFSSFKQEEIYRTTYRSLQDCKSHIAEYIEFYNSKRPHRANNYKTPNQVEDLFYQKGNEP